jgi:hypothetical protein
MKQSIMKFSVLLIIFLLSGVGSALALPNGHFLPANMTQGNMSVIINYNGTGRPGDVVNITADFNKPVANATISITENTSFVRATVGDSLPTNEMMTPLGGNSFSYLYSLPTDINGLLGVDITPLGGSNGMTPLDSNGNPVDIGSGGSGIDFSDNGFGSGIDPFIKIISPNSQFANVSCVNFNFTAYDYSNESQIVYTFWLDGVQKNNGIINSGTYKQLQFELADGKHTYEVRTKDSMSQDHTTGTQTVYVDTKCPSVTLVSPQDGFKQVIGATKFNFTCEDELAALYGQKLSYILYIDGQPVNDMFGSTTADSGVPVTKEINLADGAHNWSVLVQDGAGNQVTSEVWKFYVDLNGLTVSLDTPNGQYVSASPSFKFKVTGNSGMGPSLPIGMDPSLPFLNGSSSVKPGTGLPFNWELLIDGKVVQKGSCDEKGDYNSNEGNLGTVCCAEDCAESCFVVGKENYSIKASVVDGINKNWTVVVTDTTTGKVYQPAVNSFSVDSVAPAPVAHLYSQDKPGVTKWNDITNSPGLDVYWIPNKEKDLVTPTPYEVYVSTSKPSRIEDMELVNKTYLPIDEITTYGKGGKPLVYGKDYWVAVIARDNASNYGKDFSVYGPVQTYEDMDIQLNEGWNLKSVPQNPVDDSPASVFGENSTVLYWDGSCWQFPETIEACKGYWVYRQYPFQTSVQFKGMGSDCADLNVPPSLTLTPGWHMIGHTYMSAAPWSATLSSLKGINLAGLITDYKYSNLITYDQDEGWGGIIPDVSDEAAAGNGQNTPAMGQYIYSLTPLPVGALQSDNYMVPGQGYWIFMKDQGIYGSIEKVYQNLNNATDIDNGTDSGIDTGDFSNFNPEDPSTWPIGME